MKNLKFLLTLLIALATSLTAMAADEAAPDSLAPLSGNWLQQLAQTGFRINDPRIHYPRFANFCRKVYNWGDQTFNSYNTDYVVGTGKNWKITANASAWAQSYGYLFDPFNEEHRKEEGMVIIRSNLNYDMGVHLSFMAVSIGYDWNINQLTGHNHAPRSTFNFAFNCARFSAELQSQHTEGNTYIERFGRYNDGRRIRVPLNDVNTSLFSVRAYYYFNHRKYAQAAVYAFSKYQKRSAGTWMLGAAYARRRTEIDFTGLPDDMLAAAPQGLPLLSRFNFHDFELLGGYGYNAVMPHNWVFNFTLLPSVGYRRSLNAGKRNFSEMVSTGGYLRTGFVYNHRAFFANIVYNTNVCLVFDSQYSFMSANHHLALTVGARF